MNMNQRFKEVRQALNLTQKEFGEKLNLKPNTVAVIESGRRNVTQETVDALSFAFDVNPYWMLYGSGEMFVPRTLDEELADKFDEILNADNENRPLSHLKKLCLLEILNFNDAKWNDLIKGVSYIADNIELSRHAKSLPISPFELRIVTSTLVGAYGDAFVMNPEKKNDAT